MASLPSPELNTLLQNAEVKSTDQMLFKSGSIVILIGLIIAKSALAQDTIYENRPANAPRINPIDLRPFASCISHWRNIRDETRFIKADKDQLSYESNQVEEIVANILLFQRSNGGWPKDYDMTAILTATQREAVIATRENNDTSYDNGNIHSQVRYLASAVSQSDNPSWKSACLRGFDFMLRSQYSNGGFPQRFPLPKSFHAHITFNDGVMNGILNQFYDAANGTKPYDWLDADLRKKSKEAVERGVHCLLQCQIRVHGKLTGWCQQHHEETFEARPARTFELASLCPQETTDIVRFLMKQPSPSHELIEAVDSAMAWLQSSRLSGIRVDKIDSTAETFLRHDTDKDVVVVPDPNAKDIWARHYEIGTDRPIFAGRDGVKKYDLASIERERRTGTAWYGGWPKSLIEHDYPKWRKDLKSRQP